MTGPSGRDDEAMDRLLRKALRRGRFEEGMTPPARASACPDADTMAAYVERSLTPDEAHVVEAHAATCGRCQETLAALASLPSEPVGTRVRAGKGWFAGPWAWYHLAPLAGLAVLAIVIYVAVRPAPPAFERASRYEDVQLNGSPEADAPVRPPAASQEHAAAPAAPSPSSGIVAPRAAEPTRPKARATERADAEQFATVLPDPRTAVPPPPAQARPDAAAPADAAAARVAAAPAAPPAMAPPAAGAGQAAEVSAERVPPAPAGADTSRREVLLARKEARDGTGEVRWRPGAPGVVERSIDEGRTWEVRPTGTRATLHAVSAVSLEGAWAVGADGVVLRSRDGAVWETRAFPEAVDLVAVVARSHTVAVVTTRDGRRFETTDGGASWRRLDR